VLPWPGGLINAVGLSNPGVEAELEELAEYRRTCAKPLFVSILRGARTNSASWPGASWKRNPI
jgi:dihydroorotate dehydrogenase